MKKIILYFICFTLILFFISCFDDLDTIKKESLFEFYDEMKTEILKENIDWTYNNFRDKNLIGNRENLKSILIDNKDSLKNLISSTNEEYSVTINYVIGDCANPNRGYYIIRNTQYYPTYYYIRLINEDSVKWKIESVDKLPLIN